MAAHIETQKTHRHFYIDSNGGARWSDNDLLVNIEDYLEHYRALKAITTTIRSKALSWWEKPSVTNRMNAGRALEITINRFDGQMSGLKDVPDANVRNWIITRMATEEDTWPPIHDFMHQYPNPEDRSEALIRFLTNFKHVPIPRVQKRVFFDRSHIREGYTDYHTACYQILKSNMFSVEELTGEGLSQKTINQLDLLRATFCEMYGVVVEDMFDHKKMIDTYMEYAEKQVSKFIRQFENDVNDKEILEVTADRYIRIGYIDIVDMVFMTNRELIKEPE